jgi:hypothetical protein
MHWTLVISLTSCLIAGAPAEATTPQAATEQRCGVDPGQPAQRIFAKVSDHKPWREFKRLGDIPELSLGFGISAELWTGHERAVFVRTDQPGEDFDAYTEYCFNEGGELIHLAYELRTAWGWAFRTGGPVSNGVVRTQSTGFFDTKTEKPIPKPESADDVPDALKPTIFPRANRLPFSSLLSKQGSPPRHLPSLPPAN